MNYEIDQKFKNAIVAHKEGKLEKAEKFYRQILKLKPEFPVVHNNLAAILENQGKLKEAESNYRKSIEFKPDLALTHNNLGSILHKLNRFKEAEISYKKALDINPSYTEVYNNMGCILLKLKRFEEAEVNFRKSIELNSEYADAHYNLGLLLQQFGRLREAIESYSQALTLNPKNKEAEKYMITVLNWIIPNKKNVHPIVVASRELQNLRYNFSLESGIKKKELFNFYKDCKSILENKNLVLVTDQTQIFRRNSKSLGCNRHMKVFNELNIIAKPCFSCFKIQIEPKNVFELFKLFFIFDKLVLPKNNTRKCMIELRPKISGTYKGFIYCSSMEDINQTLKVVSPIINSLIIGKIKVKRGCSEFVDSFPDFKEIDQTKNNFMVYKNNWQEIEKVFDSQNKIELNHNGSLRGIFVSDILIMNNWLCYAKKINDHSYKSISEEVICSNNDKISQILEKQLVNRSNELDSEMGY